MKKFVLLLVSFVSLFAFASAASLSDVSLSFCNTGSDGRSLNFVVKAGESYPFCVYIKNTTKESLPLSLSFVDGEETADGLHKKACSNQGTLFTPYVSFLKTSLTLKPNTGMQVTGTLSYPLGFFGEIHGCLQYMISNQSSYVEQDTSFLNILVRKVNFIDGYVVGNFTRDVLFSPSKMVYYQDEIDNSFVVNLVFENNGIIPELFRFTGSLVNGLGYERSVSSAQELRSSTGTTVVFRFSDFPFYKGIYTFSFQGSSVLDTKLDLSHVPEKDKQPIYFTYEKRIVVVPWVIVFGIVGFFLALFFLRSFLKLVLRR